MHKKKIYYIFKLNKDLKNVNKNHTRDSNVPKSNPRSDDEERSCKSLINLKSFAQ